jgi:hypothetical protein
VLFTSGYAEGIIPQHDKSMDLVSKPYRPNELAERIRNVLDRANSAAYS